MGWEACANAINDALFCRTICFRYQIERGFVLDVKPRPDITQQKSPSFLAGGDCNFQQRAVGHLIG